LNRDNFNPNNPQFNPGRMPSPGPSPRMEGQPLTAPPNFTPEMPRMERQPGMERRTGMPGMERRTEMGRRGEELVSSRDIRRCMNRFTFIWLFNGNSFWFFPTFVTRNTVEGFRWRRDRWVFDRISLRRIFTFRCF
jgi:hypothetical protein